MNLQELIEQEYKSIFSLDIDFNNSDETSYKKQTISCGKNNVHQNSIEMYQAEQKLHVSFNYPFISNDDVLNYPSTSYAPDMSQTNIFKNLKKTLFAKKSSNTKNDKYICEVVEKYKLLLLKAIESNEYKKAQIIYSSIKVLDNDFILPEKALKYFINLGVQNDNL